MKYNLVMVLTGVAILVLINVSIWQKEEHLKTGEIIYLELAPVDPRSLMQGDYMALRYVLSNKVYTALSHSKNKENNSELQLKDDQGLLVKDGYLIAEKDEQKVMRFVRIDDNKPITATQRKLQFRYRNHQVKFATNAFFFSEGDAALFADARYGVFRLNKDGEVLLTDMLDEQWKRLGNHK